ncbi:MAG: LysM peptidoglycan-binding domain-containing protein [Candidatus Atribacteria bacterium]|nr:LysM peptidoglycan-binding domain-containing protein [Candidatus Atribacteria bacterium]
MHDFKNRCLIYIVWTVFFLATSFYFPPPFSEPNVLAQEYFEYEIKEGDCLWTIANQFQLSIQEITETNHINQEQILLPGLSLKIPQTQPNDVTQDTENPTIIHTVQKGENLWDIAQHYRLSLDCISNVNDLKELDSLSIGQKIKIPVKEGSQLENEPKNDLVYQESKSNFQGITTNLNQEFRKSIKEIEYTVKPGETLWEIAQNYQVSLKDLSDINHLENTEMLSIGQLIKIPIIKGSSKTETDEQSVAVAMKEELTVNCVEHIVEYGENISVIAQKYHLPIDTICELNKISQDSYIYPGQRIKIKVNSEIVNESDLIGTNDQKNIETIDDVPIEEHQPIYYIVKAGDTLWSVAQHYQVSLESILAVNYLSNKDVLSIGQSLEIPAIGGIFGSKAEQKIVIYKVVKGDTLWSIANKFDVKMHDIININQLNNIMQLSIGQELNIPVTGEIALKNGQDASVVIAKEKPKDVFHFVQKGETLWEISRKYQVSLTVIADANHISENDRIIVGQKLLIPNARNSSISSNNFIWPLKGLITSQFGMRTLGGRRDYHTGIDIDGRTGDLIKAAENGKVSFSGYINGYGNVVIIDHSAGYSTVYAHNSSNLVKAGQFVNKGDIIAKVGATGNSTGSHLHFEIREKGKPVNPLNYLP